MTKLFSRGEFPGNLASSYELRRPLLPTEANNTSLEAFRDRFVDCLPPEIRSRVVIEEEVVKPFADFLSAMRTGLANVEHRSKPANIRLLPYKAALLGKVLTEAATRPRVKIPVNPGIYLSFTGGNYHSRESTAEQMHRIPPHTAWRAISAATDTNRTHEVTTGNFPTYHEEKFAVFGPGNTCQKLPEIIGFRTGHYVESVNAEGRQIAAKIDEQFVGAQTARSEFAPLTGVLELLHTTNIRPAIAHSTTTEAGKAAFDFTLGQLEFAAGDTTFRNDTF